jgi:hypothetical protein
MSLGVSTAPGAHLVAPYLEALRLSPRQLVARPRPVAFGARQKREPRSRSRSAYSSRAAGASRSCASRNERFRSLILELKA